MLTEAQKRALVALARGAVDARIRGGAPPPMPRDLPGASGVFVTLKRRGELRGCLGTLQPTRDLAGAVARCAADAASGGSAVSPGDGGGSCRADG